MPRRAACAGGLGGDRRLLVVDAARGPLGELPDRREGLVAGQGLVGRGQRQQGGVGAGVQVVRRLAEEADPVSDRRQAELLQRPGQGRSVIEPGVQGRADPGEAASLSVASAR